MGVDKAVGIDLGTTNSVVGVMELDDRHQPVLAEHGERTKAETMPSVVGRDPETGPILVGEMARARIGHAPEPVTSIKRLMGRNHLAAELGLIDAAAAEGRLRAGAAPLDPSPPAVSALILGELVRRMRTKIAAESLDIEVSRAVITVPAQFTQDQLDATREAGELAGLEVTELLHEPIAAAIHYCWERAVKDPSTRRPLGDENYLVYDCGGGTTDICVVKRVHGNNFVTRAIQGDPVLGGNDFDKAIAHDMLKRLRAQHPEADLAPLPRTTEVSEALRQAHRIRNVKLCDWAEAVKISLSDGPRFLINIPDICEDNRGTPLGLETVYTREQVSALLRPLIEPTLDLCRAALAEAKLDITEIETVLMVGGSSRCPVVMEMVGASFCQGRKKTRADGPVCHDPELCVGKGAALKAASLGRVLSSRSCSARVVVPGFGTSAERSVVMRLGLLDAAFSASAPALKSKEGALSGGKVLPGAARAAFRLNLPERRQSFLALHGTSQAGAALTGFKFSLRHDPDFVEPVGLATDANVLSYSLGLEVGTGRGDETEIVELAPKLSPPTSYEHPFATPSDTGTICFKLYADGQHRKTVAVPIPSGQDAGAPFKLVVEVTPAQEVRCHGEFPGAESDARFHFIVESQGPDACPLRNDFDDLVVRLESLFAQVEPHLSAPYVGRALRIRRDIEDAFEQGDEPRLVQRMHELRKIVEELASFGLTPPFTEFEDRVEKCRKRLDWVAQFSTPAPLSDLRATLDSCEFAGREAAEATPPKRKEYEACVFSLEGVEKTVEQLVSGIARNRPAAERAPELIEHAGELLDEVGAMPLDDPQRRRHELALGQVAEAEDALAANNPAFALQQAETAQQALLHLRDAVENQVTANGDGKPPEKLRTS